MYWSTVSRTIRNDKESKRKTIYLRNNLEFFFLEEPILEKVHFAFQENTRVRKEFPDYVKGTNYYRKCTNNSSCPYCINKYAYNYVFKVPIYNIGCHTSQNLSGSLYALEELLKELELKFGESSNPEDYIYFVIVSKRKNITRYNFKIKPK
jgi:hypothetical protein